MTTARKVDKKLAIKIVTVNLETLAEVDVCNSQMGDLLTVAELTRKVTMTGDGNWDIYKKVDEALKDAISGLRGAEKLWDEAQAKHEEEKKKRRESRQPKAL